jgi:hypothetical protein
MKLKIKTYQLAVLSLVIIMAILLTGCTSIQALFQNQNYIYENGAVLVDGNDEPIELKNQPNTVDVSYAELFAFLHQDPTDRIQYVERSSTGTRPFVCSDFAEAVHNNAELSGIRTGYVSISWVDGDVGHAIDVFNTTDLGEVFIDCTGSSVYSQLENGENLLEINSWDKVAYIEIGKKYGVIGLDYARSPDYSFFEAYDEKWQQMKEKLDAYNAEVKLYNQEIAGKTFYKGSPEYTWIKSWDAELQAKENEVKLMAEEIGDSRFKPLGLVKSYTIHW